MNKFSHEDLSKQLKAVSKQVVIGGEYQHYKGNHYKVLNLGFLEATMELCVIYQAEYGEKIIFIRPLGVWLETVDVDGQSVSRFTRV